MDEGLGLPDPALEDEEEETEEEMARPGRVGCEVVYDVTEQASVSLHAEPVHKQYTVLVIKPDAVQAGKVDEIMERVESQGMEILAREEHQFTKEEAAEFYKQHEGSVSSLISLYWTVMSP